MKTPVTLIGLGSMGGAMAARLLDTGHSVTGFDALPEACERAAQAGVSVIASLAGAAEGQGPIILSLPKASLVTEVMAELRPHLKPGTVIIDTTTSEAETSRREAEAALAAGAAFLDAPVSGGPSGARAGTMTMVVGGEASALEKVRSVLDDLTAKLVHIGPSGAGNVAKIANNLLCAANLALVSEMVHLARRAGVTAEQLLEGVNAGSGRSGVSEVNFPRWILNGAFDSGFTMGLMRKDVGLAESLADDLGADAPATRAIAAIWHATRQSLPDSADFNEIYRFEASDD